MIEQGTAEGSLRRDLERAEAAKRILAEPLFVEACNRIDAQLRVMRESTEITDDKMMVRIILAEQMWGKLLDYLRATMSTAEYARNELRLRESMLERMAAAVRNGIRI